MVGTQCLYRFDLEHSFRFVKNTLGWTTTSLRAALDSPKVGADHPVPRTRSSRGPPKQRNQGLIASLAGTSSRAGASPRNEVAPGEGFFGGPLAGKSQSIAR